MSKPCAYVSLAKTVHVTQPSCKGSWEIVYLAGHLAIQDTLSILLGRENWESILRRQPTQSALRGNPRNVINIYPWIHHHFLHGKNEESNVNLLEIKTYHKKLQRGIDNVLSKLSLCWEIFVVKLRNHIFSHEDIFAITMPWFIHKYRM